ncbi:MAG TPA: single-stranded-DNA-specific exonuclease RecJ [Burkholderiaceae bacterium]|nr:single-stranded-DNA-specific exonuclease RecJ [Burkholderiaceae bacterium]
MTPILVERDAPPRTCHALEAAGVHPLLARLFAGRGVRSIDELSDDAARLLPPASLKGAQQAAELLAQAIDAGQRICVVADYDCDGATACAVALRGLSMLGVRSEALHYVVPDRRVHGYGLTPAIVELAQRTHAPALLITVDNGIASVEGVAHAHALGMRVLVTDHHLPAVDAHGEVQLPAADVIVNPNQPGCGFASKSIAGVGVMFYVLLALRALLRERGRFAGGAQPRLDRLLDLVALGTVADVVKLDANNRVLVAQGLKRVRAGRMQPGVAALLAAAGRDAARCSAEDFGFAVGPRINAAGRLADMTLGIECLLTDDATRAHELAGMLDAINRQRRDLQSGMHERSEELLGALSAELSRAAAVVLFDEGFHEGVVGIVAGRVKDRWHRPTFVFARGGDGLLKGSGRSIAGFHLRDALDLVSKREPGLLLRFGGHAMAAGCTLREDGLPAFREALQQVAVDWLDAGALAQRLWTDGALPPQWFDLGLVRALESHVWGAGFEAPLFCDEAQVLQQRLVADKHLKLKLQVAGATREAIWFGRTEPLPPRARLVFRLGSDRFQGLERLQLFVQALAE